MAPDITYASSWALQIEASARWDDSKCAAAALDAGHDLAGREAGRTGVVHGHDPPFVKRCAHS